MMMKWRNYTYRAALALFFVAIKVMAFAQPSAGGPPDAGGSTGTEPPCWEPSCVPIDGGLAFLLVAGAVFGAKMIYELRNNKSRA